MTAKAIVSYVGGLTTLVLVALLLRGRVADVFALGMGWLAMLLVGFPFMRYLSVKRLTFTKWLAFSALAAFAGTVVFVVMKRLG